MSLNRPKKEVNVHSAQSYLNISGEKTHSAQFDQTVQKDLCKSFEQVVHEVNIHKAPLSQVEQVE